MTSDAKDIYKYRYEEIFWLSGLDNDPELCDPGYGSEDHPLCPFDVGDENGLCVKVSCGCHIIGCEFSDE